MTASQGTTEQRQKFGCNGHHNNSYDHNANPRARSRFLRLANAEPPFVILCGGQDGMLAWASTVCEPERQPRALGQLLTLLDYRDRKHFAPRRKALNFPEPSVRANDIELIAQRWRLVGTPALGADRRARRRVCALKLRVKCSAGGARNAPRDDRTARRLVVGDSRQALQAVGAA